MHVRTIFDDGIANAAIQLDDIFFVQVRTGPLSVAAVDAYHDFITEQLARTATTMGALSILDGNAQAPPTAMRDRQRLFIKSAISRPNIFMTTVILGDSIQASALRTLVRVLVLGNPRLTHRRDIAEASAWLVERMGVGDARSLTETATALMTRLTPPPRA